MGWPVGLMSCLMGGNIFKICIFIGFAVPSNLTAVELLYHSTVQRWLTTAPGAPTTHWYQIRCVLSQPIYVMAGQEITGRLHMIAHNAQSYTMHLTLSGWFRTCFCVSNLLFCFSNEVCINSYS